MTFKLTYILKSGTIYWKFKGNNKHFPMVNSVTIITRESNTNFTVNKYALTGLSSF